MVRLRSFRQVTRVGVVSGLLLASSDANAWILEEHGRIGREAFARLQTDDPASRKTLDALWPTLRRRLGTQACEVTSRASATPKLGETCVDIPALAALAADHSCSPRELADTIRRASWLPKLLTQANKTILALEKGFASPHAHIDAWHEDHIQMQSIDNQYLLRAQQNGVHFLMDRSEEYGAESLTTYLRRVSGANTKFNGAAAYLLYHAQALALAAQGQAGGNESLKAQSVLVESFALHFLEDMFSAGHVVGSHGDRAMRIGTHDYYCEHGVDITTWGGTDYGAHGDAFQTGVDIAMAGAAVEASLIELAKVLDGRMPAPVGAAAAIEDFDICTPMKVSPYDWSIIREVLADPETIAVMQRTPRPFREGYAPPRFENEIGAFLRGTMGGRALGQLAGVDEGGTPYTPRGRGSLEIGLGLGVALAGAVTEGMDALAFVHGFATANSKEFSLDPGSEPVAIPKRFSVGGRVRMPFLIFPGDMLFYGLFVLPFSMERFLDLGIRAAQGGAPFLLPWRLEKVFMMGPFTGQVILGREVALSRLEREIWKVDISRAAHSWELELPVFEARTKPKFSGRLGGGGFAQLGVGVTWHYELLRGSELSESSERLLGRNLMVFLRVGADGRFYFARF
ncbi:MAG: hypothetical protein KF782_25370 [Labilithrix sp.]|nr:hypothetical protein [Labilithrix sp.]